jgi:hypothetical protein
VIPRLALGAGIGTNSPLDAYSACRYTFAGIVIDRASMGYAIGAPVLFSWRRMVEALQLRMTH